MSDADFLFRLVGITQVFFISAAIWLLAFPTIITTPIGPTLIFPSPKVGDVSLATQLAILVLLVLLIVQYLTGLLTTVLYFWVIGMIKRKVSLTREESTDVHDAKIDVDATIEQLLKYRVSIRTKSRYIALNQQLEERTADEANLLEELKQKRSKLEQILADLRKKYGDEVSDLKPYVEARKSIALAKNHDKDQNN